MHVSGIARYAGEHGWHLTTDLGYVQALQAEWQGDGIITQEYTPDADRNLIAFLKRLPQVRVAIGADVANDDHLIGELVAQHYQDAGLKHLATYGPGGGFEKTSRFSIFGTLCLVGPMSVVTP